MKEKEIIKLISNNLAMLISAKDALESLSEMVRVNMINIERCKEQIKILEGRLSKLAGRLTIPLDVADEFQTEDNW